LQELKYVGSDGKRFWLTPRILDLGYSYLSSMELWGFAEEYVEDLVQRVHESCSISILDGHDIVYVLRVPTRRILKSSLSVGSRLPAHVVSMGRIQLAALPPDALDAWLATAELKPFTRHTITDRAKLKRIIIEDGKKGWSLVDRELEEGISGIGVPLLNRRGQTIAAMNINMSPEQARKRLDRLLKELRKTADQINAVLRLRQ
jgi:IclR family pca regulon transcriptional regulator